MYIITVIYMCVYVYVKHWNFLYHPLCSRLAPQVSPTFPVKLWLSCIAQNVWMFTPPNPPVIITQMEHILALDSPICSLWFTQNIDPRDLPISLFLGKLMTMRKVLDCVTVGRICKLVQQNSNET